MLYISAKPCAILPVEVRMHAFTNSKMHILKPNSLMCFPECLKDALTLSDAELLKKGLNIAQNHVDMMIGTPDLKIEAETFKGKKVTIFVDGKFDI